MNNKILIFFLSLVIIGLLALLIVSNNSQATSPALLTPTQDKQSLDLEKQRLEVLKLNNEINSISLSPILQAGTLSAALIAAAISFWNAWKSQKNQVMIIQAQAEQQQKNHISNLLKELGSSHVPVKIAAIHALSEYESAIPFLVSVLRVDNDSRILIPIETALLQYPQTALKQLLEVNRTINKQRMDLAGKFVCMDYPVDDVCELLSIDKPALEKSLKASRFFQLSKKFNATLKEKCAENPETEEVRKTVKQKLLEERKQVMSTLENTQSTIERLIQKVSLLDKPFVIRGAALEGIILNRLNLAGWSFEFSDLRNARFSEADCRNVNFSGTNISNGNFFSANLEGAKLDNSNLEKTRFVKANCTNASISNSNCNHGKFNASNLQSANLSDTTFIEGEFHAATLNSANLKNCRLFKTKFISSDLSDANLDDSYFGGGTITGTKVYRATFKKAKIEGVAMKKCNFDGSDFSRTKFASLTVFEQCSFDDVELNDAVFSKNTEEFKNISMKKIGLKADIPLKRIRSVAEQVEKISQFIIC